MLLVGCSSGHLEPAEVQGPPAMVDDGGKPRLWVLTKQEEVLSLPPPHAAGRNH
jgi:hypothetical protein